MNRLSIVVLAGCCVANLCEARMYQWVNADTGHVQLSGKPPAWYRAGRPGPRVLVFENGKLVDDTRRALSAADEQTVRNQALRAIAAQPARGAGSAQQSGALHGAESMDKEQRDAETVARMKAIIAEWEQRQTPAKPEENTPKAADPAESPEPSTGAEEVQ